MVKAFIWWPGSVAEFSVGWYLVEGFLGCQKFEL